MSHDNSNHKHIIIADQYGIPVNGNITDPQKKKEFEIAKCLFHLKKSIKITEEQEKKIKNTINNINENNELQQTKQNVIDNSLPFSNHYQSQPLNTFSLNQQAPITTTCAIQRNSVFIRTKGNSHMMKTNPVPAEIRDVSKVKKLSSYVKGYDYRKEANTEKMSKIIGRKIGIKYLLDKEFIIITHQINESKINANSVFASIQIEFDGEKRLIFTSAKIIIKTLENAKPYDPMRVVLRKHPITNYYYLDDPE